MAGERAAQLNAIAQRAGFPTYYAYRNAKAKSQGYSGAGEQRRARAAGKPSPLDPGKAAQGRAVKPRRQVYKTTGGNVVKTTSGGRGYGVLESQLRKARPGQHVKMLVDVKTPQGTRRVDLFKRGGYTVDGVRRLIRQHGGLSGAVAAAIAELYEGESWAEEPDIEAVQMVIS